MKRTADESGLKRFRKIGGGSFHTTIGGKMRIIKPGEVFKARPEEIPEGFRDVVKAVDDDVVFPTKQIPSGPPPTKLEYFVKPRGAKGYFDVVDKDGKVQNEKALRKEKAEELLETLLK